MPYESPYAQGSGYESGSPRLGRSPRGSLTGTNPATGEPYTPRDYKQKEYSWYTRVDPTWGRANLKQEGTSPSLEAAVITPQAARAKASADAHIKRQQAARSTSPSKGPAFK
jgi:hypothetical protein